MKSKQTSESQQASNSKTIWKKSNNNKKIKSSVPFSQAVHWCDECSCLCIHFKINSNLSDWKQHDNSSLDHIFHTFHKWFWIHTNTHTCAVISFVHCELKIWKRRRRDWSNITPCAMDLIVSVRVWIYINCRLQSDKRLISLFHKIFVLVTFFGCY